ncbi:MAG: hypothetical protein HUJ51_06685 [Eggerthellaceae bacterium]|nr:hypothetical protein [Eggerthellaceae bacterium]
MSQRCGVDEAGMFSMAFVIASLLMIVGNFGMRTFQVSDIKEKLSFIDYHISRVLN